MRTILQEEAQWFADWAASRSLPPIDSAYNVLIPHGKNTVDFNRTSPLQGEPATDFLISPMQGELLDRIFLEHFSGKTRCCLAMYAGFMHTAWGKTTVLMNLREPGFLVA